MNFDKKILSTLLSFFPYQTSRNSLFPIIFNFFTKKNFQTQLGREIVFEAQKWLKEEMPEIKRYVTLSPLTEMARRFHLRNGAKELQVNSETQNFEYE